MLKNFSPVDHLLNKVYTSRWSPLYQSGALAMFLFLVAAVSGVYLLLFYDVGNPHESVESIWNQVFFGRWIRSVHRYASDAAVVAIAFHILKMVTTGRSYGKRLRAWVSGWVLLFGVMVCGWTGFLLIWDVQAQWLALELSRIFDILPIFSAPLQRIFSSAQLPSSFFFSLLFLHVAVPLGLLAVYLLHISKVARPTHQPPRAIRYFALAGLLTVAVLWPVGIEPISDPSKLLGVVKINIFYTGLLPLLSRMPVWAIWVSLFATAILLAFGVPLLTKPKTEEPKPSWVDSDLCTGCYVCYQDCPYEAIAMVKRTGDEALDPRRSEYVAKVDPTLCVSCGICAGSCAPMGVGPPDHTGRAQLTVVKDWWAENEPADALVVIACDKSFSQLEEPNLYLAGCIGAVHTSVIEWLIRKGAAGVFMLSCPARDCFNREGPSWSHERIYNDREAELQPRVDKNRVRTRAYARTEMALARADIAQFREELVTLETSVPEASPKVEKVCVEKVPIED
jgi:quinol-cytochrome oxidoreductase complex cytochrome b subunit/Fe-S-cluster-containing hydrogenase component 2/coenzyme F420-reducing hydrogenase delta subunit